MTGIVEGVHSERNNSSGKKNEEEGCMKMAVILKKSAWERDQRMAFMTKRKR